MKISSKTVTIHASIKTVEDILKDPSKGNLLVFGKSDPVFLKKYEISNTSADEITLLVRFGKFQYIGIVTPISDNQCAFKLVMSAWLVLILGLVIGARGLAYSEHGILIAVGMFLVFFLLARFAASFWMNYLIKKMIAGENILFPN